MAVATNLGQVLLFVTSQMETWKMTKKKQMNYYHFLVVDPLEIRVAVVFILTFILQLLCP